MRSLSHTDKRVSWAGGYIPCSHGSNAHPGHNEGSRMDIRKKREKFLYHTAPQALLQGRISSLKVTLHMY